MFLTYSWRGKSTVIRIYYPLTLNGYSNFIKAVKRQRNLGLGGAFLNMIFLITKLTTVDVNIHALNRQIWYRHPNKENTKVRPEMTKFKMSREKVNMDFHFVGITF
jgi:hypothetical protein